MSMSTSTTSLPSIKFLLNQSSEDKKYTRGHRASHSVSSLPTELQNLSLNAPHAKDDLAVDHKQLLTSNSATTSTSVSSACSSPSHTPQHPSPSPPTLLHPVLPSSRPSHHQRSVSDLPHLLSIRQQYQSASPIPLYQPTPTYCTTLSPPNPSPSSSREPFAAQTSNAAILPPPPPPPPPAEHRHLLGLPPSPHRQPSSMSTSTSHRKRHQTHRRAVSATTVDHLIHPSHLHVPPVPPIPWAHRSHSNSPPGSPMDAFINDRQKKSTVPGAPSPFLPTQSSTPSQPTSPPSVAADPEDEDPAADSARHLPTHAMVNGMRLPRDMVTGRYLCPYCQKAFSRPSSLRIHTYSHTGEKPFVCSEKGCGRRFSVQSNMRRHLRVHRLGRKHQYMRMDYLK
ncbi:hypothetical protein DM01DRAFT_1406826 [Hesseltinella vesiculosa]|uniref:C2H2-type domain-containing protein n=1 Tax=Hesseltinella vesiculosa TaxID=101127 RepID=A0A1X2GL77_9FUNG|nr:hypothetical protein DM01DRAFT_1406826 [Hesseltinella vesiculosa]